MAIVTKTIRGRAYLYEQKSTRVAGKVVTKSTYIGPVGGRPRRRKRVLGQVGKFTATNVQYEHYFDMEALGREAQKVDQQKEAKIAALHADLHERYGFILGPRIPVPIEKPLRNDAFLYAKPATDQQSAQPATEQQDVPTDVSDETKAE